MHRRVGIEAHLGIGGGTVSREAAENLEKAEDLCRRRKPMQALPYLRKAMKDPNNLDAAVQMAFLMPTLGTAVQLLEDAKAQGRVHLKSCLSPTCFDDGDQYAERFWSLLETRPYMRVLQAIVRLAFENGDYNKSADTIIEMLRHCPGDNMGQRSWLGSVLLQAGRTEHALSFAQAWLDPRHDDGSWPPRGGCAFNPPSRAPLSKDFIEKNKKHGPGASLYTAALASFKLWGDCEVARQYLRIAASANPHVLLKVLGKVDRPKSLNFDPRSFNGQEEAHDYLWLTQDLWMAPDVWAWADSDAEVKSYVLKRCVRAGCDTREVRVAEFKRCGGCKEVVYCGQACQKEDWKAHKPRCKEHQEQKRFMKAMMNSRTTPLSESGGGPIVASADFSAAGISTTFH
ncbi:uncharacterized protein TRAVEDRAFT_27483 [Trametes versicolor FP-101664 SS1]|uniref:uncharacterized protein n=1 Tax=Trametes versicolor (strain FP-101664) TaxID=717944 RepID=UPI00046247A1|nr:uncharacterized protein TRAVEDRAFT_27483 [Trametes versicolor FP-101664 SS1]EIW62110.1 hypothetical protein TRAVEDRAFT_27483 [Trametes versicolor FP-101664 SS1]